MRRGKTGRQACCHQPVSSESRGGEYTRPSAQSSICASGRFALYIDVVHHHIGNPNNNITSQNDRMTYIRSRILSGFSAGGSFLVGAASTAWAGAFSSLLTLSSLESDTASPAMEGFGSVGMVVVLVVASAETRCYGSPH